jgi:uncharacterized membrane protein affecting hemolysin expression
MNCVSIYAAAGQEKANLLSEQLFDSLVGLLLATVVNERSSQRQSTNNLLVLSLMGVLEHLADRLSGSSS